MLADFIRLARFSPVLQLHASPEPVAQTSPSAVSTGLPRPCSPCERDQATPPTPHREPKRRQTNHPFRFISQLIQTLANNTLRVSVQDAITSVRQTLCLVRSGTRYDWSPSSAHPSPAFQSCNVCSTGPYRGMTRRGALAWPRSAHSGPRNRRDREDSQS